MEPLDTSATISAPSHDELSSQDSQNTESQRPHHSTQLSRSQESIQTDELLVEWMKSKHYLFDRKDLTNKQVYQRAATAIAEETGRVHNLDATRKRWERLVAAYKKFALHAHTTGAARQEKPPFFDDIHCILQRRPMYTSQYT